MPGEAIGSPDGGWGKEIMSCSHGVDRTVDQQKVDKSKYSRGSLNMVSAPGVVWHMV